MADKNAALKTIAFSCGCFWCTEGIMSLLPGVKSTEIGYAGGNHKEPTYNSVSSNPDGHAETTLIYYDTETINLETLLDVFFAIHDPNKTFVINDKKGPLYRSVIHYSDLEDKSRIGVYIQKHFKNKILTEVIQLRNFGKSAEKYQSYYSSNPDKPFCQNIIEPKIKALVLQGKLSKKVLKK